MGELKTNAAFAQKNAPLDPLWQQGTNLTHFFLFT